MRRIKTDRMSQEVRNGQRRLFNMIAFKIDNLTQPELTQRDLESVENVFIKKKLKNEHYVFELLPGQWTKQMKVNGKKIEFPVELVEAIEKEGKEIVMHEGEWEIRRLGYETYYRKPMGILIKDLDLEQQFLVKEIVKGGE